MTTAAKVLDDPDFTDSRQLRIICNIARRNIHRIAMEIHVAAAELEAALMTIPAVDGNRMTSRSIQRRRARRVSRHMKHAAECQMASSAAMVRTWTQFRAEYAPELSPDTRGKRTAFKVVPE